MLLVDAQLLHQELEAPGRGEQGQSCKADNDSPASLDIQGDRIAAHRRQNSKLS